MIDNNQIGLKFKINDVICLKDNFSMVGTITKVGRNKNIIGNFYQINFFNSTIGVEMEDNMQEYISSYGGKNE